MIKNMFIGEEEFLTYQETFNTNEAVVTDMIRFEVPELKYRLSAVPIGFIKGTREIYYLDMSKSRRILILGSTGSGKTTLKSGLEDRFMKSGGAVSIFDLKGEFINKYKPLQSKYANKMMVDRDTGQSVPKYLFDAERAQGFPLRSYRPVFLHRIMEAYGQKQKMSEFEHLCQLGLVDLEKADLFIFFEQLTSRNSKYYEVIDILWDSIEKQKLDTWEKILSFIDAYEDFDKNAKKTLTRTLKLMRTNETIGDNYDPPTMVQDIAEKRLNIMNLKGMLNMPQASSPALMYVNIMLRQIYNAKVRGRIKKNIHNMIDISEINKFVPRLGDTPAKQEFLKILDLVRSERISIIMDTQDWKRIPDTLIEQSDYIFLPYNIDLENMKEIVKKILPQEYESPHDYAPKLSYWQKRMQKLKDGRRDWLILDRHDKEKQFIVPVMPLSYLSEETDEN